MIVRSFLGNVALLVALALSPDAQAAEVRLSGIEVEFTNRVGFQTGSFQPNPLVPLGWVGLDANSGLPGFTDAENRFVVQFSLFGTPPAAAITHASLRLTDSLGADNILVFGFAGDGSFTEAVASESTGTRLFQTLAGTTSPVSYDVTAFVQGLAAGDYAGFLLRQSPVGGAFGTFESRGGPLAPLLTITYTEPAPTQVPAPASVALLAAGVLTLGVARRRRDQT